MDYLARDELYSSQKPYSADFSPGITADRPRTNHVFEAVNVDFHDVRDAKDSFSLDVNGFCYVDCTTSATAETLSSGDPSAIRSYCDEMENVIQSHFPEYSRVDVIDYQVWKCAVEGRPSKCSTKANETS